MSTAEIVLNMLAEVSTTELSKTIQPGTFEQNRSVAKQGGQVAGNARKELEAKTGKPVATKQNALDFTKVIEDTIDSDR
jgi:hypothetical protein